MEYDLVRNLGYKALDSRFKRISDRISHDVRKLYRLLNIDVEPHWYLVFMLLEAKDNVSITHIAEQLGYSHPTAVMLVKKMSEKGYLTSTNDLADRRKQMVSLSEKAKTLMPSLKILWKSCEEALLQIIGEDNSRLMHSLDQIDRSMKEISFHDRFKEAYQMTNTKER